ncbi:MAG: flagellar hook-length control protein FliK [Marinobacter sp.]|uniref:flagellar hook-length control protein FliK n=1 Tax=Marinobacter sp. TaxID=50741 RepID=UPI0034A05738
MPGSVLPISPPPDLQGATTEKSPSANREAPDNRQYESVSRQEQQRLDRREAARAATRAQQDQRAEDRRADRLPADKSAGVAGTAQAKTSPAKPSDRDLQADPASSDENTVAAVSSVEDDAPETDFADIVPPAGLDKASLEVEASDADLVFTFADLQALISERDDSPVVTGQGAVPGLPGLTGQTPSAPGLMAGVFEGMLGGKGNSTTGQGRSSAETTLKLMESLVGQLSAEAGKTADTGSAIASRFQGSLDLASQSLTAAAGQKPLEAAIPLRSYTTSVELPVGHAEWGDKLMGKLAWLTSQNMSMAEIHLTPADMGPMEVRVQVQNDQAAVTVHTTNSAVRDQLELHSHRLRDMLGAQGLGLESFDVSDSSTRSGQGQGGDQSEDVHGNGVVSVLDDDELQEAQGVLDLSWKGELDLYA